VLAADFLKLLILLLFFLFFFFLFLVFKDAAFWALTIIATLVPTVTMARHSTCYIVIFLFFVMIFVGVVVRVLVFGMIPFISIHHFYFVYLKYN